MLSYLLLALGMFFLVLGAKYLVDGSSSLAKILRVKPMLIGLTVLAFGTSLPELAISLFASVKGITDITIGNIIGSNINDLLLVLGISSCIIAIKIKHNMVKKGLPFTVLAVASFLLLANDSLFSDSNALSRADGLILLLFFTVFMIYIFIEGEKERKRVHKEIEISTHSEIITALMIIVGIAMLSLGGKLVVENAVKISNALGISRFLVSATIVSIGSTLPELIVSIISAVRKKVDFIIGNLIGSIIFKSLFVLGLSSVIRPIPFNTIFNFDLIFMFSVTSLLLIFMYTGKKDQIKRWNSILFILLYIFYITYIIARG